MFDPVLRRWMNPPLDRAGTWLAQRSMSANGASLAGLAIGLLAVPLLAYGHYEVALAVILLNRLVDGLDGAIARQRGVTAFGGYLDIICDMAFYAAIPVGFALASPHNALWAALLLASFVCTATSFLGRAACSAAWRVDGRRGRVALRAAESSRARRLSSCFLFCLFPRASGCWVFALLCCWTLRVSRRLSVERGRCAVFRLTDIVCRRYKIHICQIIKESLNV